MLAIIFFLYCFLSYRLEFDNHSVAQNENDLRVATRFLTALTASFLYFFLSSLPLTSRSQTTLSTDTTTPPRLSHTLSFYLFLALSLRAFTLSIQYLSPARSPLLYKLRHTRQVALMYIRPPSCSSRRASYSVHHFLIQEIHTHTFLFTPLRDFSPPGDHLWNCRPLFSDRRPRSPLSFYLCLTGRRTRLRSRKISYCMGRCRGWLWQKRNPLTEPTESQDLPIYR